MHFLCDLVSEESSDRVRAFLGETKCPLVTGTSAQDIRPAGDIQVL